MLCWRTFYELIQKDVCCYCCVYTDSTLRIERTEPATAQDKHDQDEQWYARVNSECRCGKAEKCGDKYRTAVHDVKAEDAMNTLQEGRKLYMAVYHAQERSRPGSSHYSKLSATCDHAHMPREVLPRVGQNRTVTPDKWPYLSQSTVNDVKAMRFIRSQATHRSYVAKWQILQQRLQQYATTGAGTIAEAIVVNDYWWNGQVAHEKPSGNRAQARNRRTSKAK
jgi:hypothetical protein